MSISLSDASLKTYRQLLPASLTIMKKAEKYFTDEGADLNYLLNFIQSRSHFLSIPEDNFNLVMIRKIFTKNDRYRNAN